MSIVKFEVVYASFYDEKLPATNITHPHNNSFTVTTGGFPHEIVLRTISSYAHFSQIICRFHQAKHVVVEVQRYDDGSTRVVFDSELAKAESLKELQVANISLEPSGDGEAINEVHIRILSGYSEFVGVFPVDVFGEESMQRLAVLESSPEVVM